PAKVRGGPQEGQGLSRSAAEPDEHGLGAVPEGDLTSALLKQVSRSFYLSLAVLPAAVRPPIALAYLLARAADTIADTRLIGRAERIDHLEALGDELTSAAPGRLAAIIGAAGGPPPPPPPRPPGPRPPPPRPRP